MEDRETLEGASIDAVRDLFVKWRDEHSVERKPHWTSQVIPTAKDPPLRLPRFTYCLYVDQKCLNTVTAFAEKFPPPHRFAPIPPPLVAVMIDGDFDESQYVRGGSRAALEDQGEFPAIDGRTCKYVGWEYVDVQSLGSLYDNLHSRHMDSPRDYKRPPKISPLGYEALTDEGIQRV